MSELNWALTEGDIEWQRTSTHENGEKRPEPVVVTEFSNEQALAHLMINEVVFLGNNIWNEKEQRWFKQDYPHPQVLCNDVFAWGCADSEPLPEGQIETLYKMWRKDPGWGPAVWCIMQRKQMPQKPVEEMIREEGIWDLDKLGVGPNTMDAEVHEYMNRFLSQVKNENSP